MSTIRATFVQHGSSPVPNITLNASGQVIVASGIVSSGTFAAPSGSVSAPGFYFVGDSNTGIYSPVADTIAFTEGGVEALRIDSSGRVGIGTTSPSAIVHANSGSASDVYFRSSNSLATSSLGTAADGSTYVYNSAAYPVTFSTNATERARIDSSGRLLVGTSSARTNFFNTTQSANIQLEGTSGTAVMSLVSNADASTGNSALVFGKTRGTAVGSTTIIQSGDSLGRISFQGSDGTEFVQAADILAEVDGTPGANDMPGRLVFSTTADGASSPTERMRIDNNGDIGLSTTSDGLFGKDPRLAVAKTVAAGRCVVQINAAGSVGNTDRNALECIDDGGEKLFIRQNGNVVNLNNSYGAISDAKLKENVVDASSQWADIKALKVRNYNFKSDLSRRQIGVVAQELELVSPGIVTDSPDYDAEGNDLGTVTKSVNYSVLYMKAVKALQEAMERIETLEAKVAAFETP